MKKPPDSNLRITSPASPPEDATIATEIYYRVVHSRRSLLSKFQSNQTRSFVLTACGNGRVRGFDKYGKRAISVGDSILVFGRKSAQQNQRAFWMLCTVTLLLQWRPSKIGLTSFNVVARRTLVFDEPRPGAPKTDTTENNVKKSMITW